MFDNIRKRFANLLYKTGNAMSLPDQFLRFGNQQRIMGPNWSQVWMTDQDKYTGYGFAVITKRARATSRIARQFISSKVPDTKQGEEEPIHPYLPLIQDSLDFTEDQFWQTISTYLDLEGWFPLAVIRNTNGKNNPDGSTDLGSALKFKLLNPYKVERVIDEDGNVGGYRETNEKGLIRDWSADMIIDIRELNPFNKNTPYAMTDAAEDSSFTLKSAGDYTRHALNGNINAPGIITTDVVLDAEKFKNFTERVKDHTKGEPIFGNGAGKIQWTSMAQDLTKSGLKDIHEINRQILFADGGVSKTLMGIEESGTTRETANVQKDLFYENEMVPRVETITGALNLDYKNRYANQYQTKKVVIFLNNPIEADQDVETKKVANKKTSFELYQSLLDAGYKEDIASRYVSGEINLDELGQPTNPPKVDPVTELKLAEIKTGKKNQSKQLNKLPDSVMHDQQSMLQNSIVNIEGQLAVAAINRIPKKIKNAIDEESDVITKTEKKEAVNELILVLTAFYGIISTLQGNETIKDRIEKYGGEGKFLLDKIAKEGINKTAELVAESHIDSVSNELFELARKAALEGKSQLQIIGEIKSRYSHDITENRAKMVARTETNRAFTMAQFDADRQFIKQNNLGSRAFKQYHTRSSNPCPFCKSLEAQGLIPFEAAFVKKGGQVSAKVDGKEMVFDVNFASVYAGNLHPNCSCDYELVIMPEEK